VSELAQKYRDVFDTPTRSRNKKYLQSHVAWRIQELAEGGLSPRAITRIEQLAPQAPPRWRRPVAKHDGAADPAVTAAKRAHDPRLPAEGTTLTRLYDGVEHQVTVLASGFSYQGVHYRSLSKIAA